MELPVIDHNMSDESLQALLEKMTTDAHDIQEEVLSHILSKNAETEYLARFLGHSLKTCAADDAKELFKKKVPLVEYESILPFVERIANGEPHSILSGDPILELHASSATSGRKYKLFCKSAQELSQFGFYFTLAHNILKKAIGEDGGKRMYILFLSPEYTTPGGIIARASITSFLKSNASDFSDAVCTSPSGVRLCEDEKQSMYSHLLCGLVQRDMVVTVGSIFAAGLFSLLKHLEIFWREICSNIRSGCISDWIKDAKCREALASVLPRPMPELADSIEKECMKKSWEGIIKKLWPRTKCLEVIVTGSMAQYIPKLEFYSGGNIPLASMIYGTSEGLFGVNLKPLSTDPYNVSYCLIPWMAYYEFLPVYDHQTSEEEEVVDLANLKIGQQYELVVTTYAGLNRYKMGDVLMPTGFMNNVPQFRFVRRKNVVLSIGSDKTTEEDLLNAVTKARREVLEPRGFILVDFTSCVDLSSFPGHYVLFWELQSINGEDDDVAEQMARCCSVVEESLDEIYWEYREGKNIGPLEIRVVRRGAFDEFTEFCVKEVGSSLSQFKAPKCLQSDKAIQLFNSMVVATSFSTADAMK